MPRYRIAVDTGGTFSDFVYLNEDTGAVAVGKIPSTPDDPSRAIVDGIEALLGGGIGLCGTPISAIAMSAVDVPRAGMASAVVNSLRQVGQVFGVAVLGALVYARLPGGAGGRPPRQPSIASRSSAVGSSDVKCRSMREVILHPGFPGSRPSSCGPPGMVPPRAAVRGKMSHHGGGR